MTVPPRVLAGWAPVGRRYETFVHWGSTRSLGPWRHAVFAVVGFVVVVAAPFPWGGFLIFPFTVVLAVLVYRERHPTLGGPPEHPIE